MNVGFHSLKGLDFWPHNFLFGMLGEDIVNLFYHDLPYSQKTYGHNPYMLKKH